jgi:hypothetical protein
MAPAGMSWTVIVRASTEPSFRRTCNPVKAVTANAGRHPLPNLTLTRGARRLRFFERRRALVVMRGGIQHTSG